MFRRMEKAAATVLSATTLLGVTTSNTSCQFRLLSRHSRNLVSLKWTTSLRRDSETSRSLKKLSTGFSETDLIRKKALCTPSPSFYSLSAKLRIPHSVSPTKSRERYRRSRLTRRGIGRRSKIGKSTSPDSRGWCGHCPRLLVPRFRHSLLVGHDERGELEALQRRRPPDKKKGAVTYPADIAGIRAGAPPATNRSRAQSFVAASRRAAGADRSRRPARPRARSDWISSSAVIDRDRHLPARDRGRRAAAARNVGGVKRYSFRFGRMRSSAADAGL
jgi:hypothetical protein